MSFAYIQGFVFDAFAILKSEQRYWTCVYEFCDILWLLIQRLSV